MADVETREVVGGVYRIISNSLERVTPANGKLRFEPGDTITAIGFHKIYGGNRGIHHRNGWSCFPIEETVLVTPVPSPSPTYPIPGICLVAPTLIVGELTLMPSGFIQDPVIQGCLKTLFVGGTTLILGNLIFLSLKNVARNMGLIFDRRRRLKQEDEDRKSSHMAAMVKAATEKKA